MAPVAADEIALRVCNRATLDPKAPIGGNLGERSAQEIDPMTCFAPGLVLGVKLTVALIGPRDVVHVVETVRTVCGQLEAPGLAANRAVHELPRIPLEGLCRHVVVGRIVCNRPLGVSAAVAVFAGR